ncbi:MAG TPA: hypothetical protein VGR91_18105 [Stellaceae bacterium]|nr:hypothetical protein [Stellaceae bacterium]
MRKLLLGSVFALLFLVPLGASAQSAAAPPQPSADVGTAKVLAIGIGAILGVAAAQAIVVGDGVALVGGIAGGVIAAWWYGEAAGGAKPAGLRQSLFRLDPPQAQRISMAL